MRITRLFAAAVCLLAGVAVLAAQDGPAPGFKPSRFSVVNKGKAGKPDLILIPGLASSRAVWDDEAKLLAPNYRLHLVQVNGFAGASAGPNASGPLLVPLVEELHAYIVLNRLHPIVVGHSFGGLMALMLADRHPEDVSKLVIVDALPYSALNLSPDATLENFKPQVEAFRQQMTHLPADRYAAMQPILANQMVRNLDAQPLVAASFVASDRAVVIDAMVDAFQTDLRPDLPSIKTPTLVIYAYDPTAQPPNPKQYDATVQESYKLMPQVTLERMDGSRHFIMYDEPDKFDAALEAFLK
jgi:pimeloyl-ACP methyl ester carboxylesterase